MKCKRKVNVKARIKLANQVFMTHVCAYVNVRFKWVKAVRRIGLSLFGINKYERYL